MGLWNEVRKANSNGFFSKGFHLLFFFVDAVDAVAALNRSFLLSLQYNPLFVLVCIMDLARSKVSATEPEAMVAEVVFGFRVPKGGSLEPWSPEISAVEPGARSFY